MLNQKLNWRPNDCLKETIWKKVNRIFEPLNIFQRAVLKEMFLFLQMNSKIFKMAYRVSFATIDASLHE